MSMRAPKPDVDQAAVYRAQVGAFVKHRLMNTPGVFKIPSQGLDVFVLRDFLTPEECVKLCELIDADRASRPGFFRPRPTRISGPARAAISAPGSISTWPSSSASTLCSGSTHSHGETIQGQRYAVGQQFKPHHDFFYVDQPYWPEQERTGGQRTWTAMMFLNEPEAGGADLLPARPRSR